MMEKCQAITKEDVLVALRKYLLPLFDASTSAAIVVTIPSKVDEISEALSAGGFNVSKQELDQEEEGTDDSISEDE
jgi:hypothetical protein